MLEQPPTNEEPGSLLTLNEVTNITNQSKRHKSPGFDGIPKEIHKEGGEELTKHIYELIVTI